MAATTGSRNGPNVGHGFGLGSGSGAGQWLSSAASVDSVERELGASENTNTAAQGRTYRISAAETVNYNTAMSDDLLLRLNPSGSGEVDLDLSFDFVSQLENSRPAKTPIKGPSDRSPVKNAPINGMSTAKRWGNNNRKQPPTAINVLKKKAHLAANDLTSQFSPISPLDHKRDQEEEPLSLLRLGNTKRAADSGITSPVDDIDRAALIRQQRTMAQMKQQNSTGKTSPKKKTVLGENKAMLNAHIGQMIQNDDIFNDLTHDYHKQLMGSDNFPSMRQNQPQQALANNDNNMLGLDLHYNGNLRPENQASHLDTQTTTSPALSDLFSDSGTARGSEFTHGTVSDGATTPGTAFSTLFEDRQQDHKMSLGSTQMERGPSAPASIRPLVNDIIEEDRLSMMRTNTAPSSTMEPDRQSNEFLDASNSDLGSSPIKGDQQMVLSTADSMTDNTDFLFRHPGQQQMKGSTDESNLAHGLGIDLGQVEDKNIGHLHMDLSELSVERAMLPTQDIALDIGTGDYFAQSQSFTSSAEGFAMNTTPMGYKQADLRINVPTTIDEMSPRNDSTKTPKWKTKFWKIPFNRNNKDSEKTPTMKSLLLVDRSKDQDMGPLSAPLPSSAIFAPHLQMPPAAWHHNSSRNSKSSIMTSRLRYLPNEEEGGNHITVSVESPEMTQQAEIRSPQSSTLPITVLTPKMEYIRSARNRRHSWGYSSDASLMETPAWLTAADQSRGDSIIRNSTLSAVGQDNLSNNSSLLQAPVMETIVEDGIRRRTTRHRATNSVPISPTMLPNEWTSPHPDYLYEEDAEEKAQRARFEFQQEDQDYYDSQKETRRRRTRTLGSRMSIFGPASIAITPYLVGLTGTRNRSKMVKTTSLKPSVYSKAEGQVQIRLFSEVRGPAEGLFAYSGRALENASPSKSLFFAGFLAMPWLWFIGGWGLQHDGSIYIDRDIFWDQNNEELIKIELLRQQNFAATKAAYASGLRYNQETILPMHRNSILQEDSDRIKDVTDEEEERYSMGRPESMNQHDIFEQRNISRPQSLVETSSWMRDTIQEEQFQAEDNRDWVRARKARSLLVGEERNSIQPMSLAEFRQSVAYPGQYNADDMHPIDLGFNNQDDQAFGIAYSTNENPPYFPDHYIGGPKSQWDQFEDVEEKGKRNNRNTFFQQIFTANSQVMSKLATASSRVNPSSAFKYQTRRQQQQKQQNQQLTTYVESRSIMSILFDDWTKLERFVLFNRIMAMSMSLVVFGAAGVAIWVVIADW